MERIKALREQVKIQRVNGNWNYDPYMYGMANGLICALATIEGVEPEYLDPPKTWLCDNRSEEGSMNPDTVKAKK